MEINTFIANYREAFGAQAELPIAFWYSDTCENPAEKINGCFFKSMHRVRNGSTTLSLNADSIGCGGGKLYTGFAPMPEHVPHYVSLKEKYKQTPEMVVSFIEDLRVPAAGKAYLHFARIDTLASLHQVEGILFLATPDMLSGLATWAYFDNNRPDAVSAPFGSGCSAVVTQTILENRAQGRRTFLGCFDPSVRPHLEADVLSFTIPMSRFREMCATMRQCCLFDTHAWQKIKCRLHAAQARTPIPERPVIALQIAPDLLLREVAMEDAAEIYHAIDSHRDYLRTWLPFVDHLKSVADEEDFLHGVLSAPTERYEPVFGIRNDRNELCGLIGFHFSDFANRRTEIGYWLLPEYQHRGIMTACVRRLCQWAVEARGMKRIQIRCAAGNAASNGIPLRLGFCHEGTERAGELLASGEYADIEVYSVLQEEVQRSMPFCSYDEK